MNAVYVLFTFIPINKIITGLKTKGIKLTGLEFGTEETFLTVSTY